MPGQDLATLSAVGSIVGIVSFFFGLYFGVRQARIARREAREARQLLEDMNSTLGVLASKHLEPVEPLLRRGIIFSIWTTVARLGSDTTVDRVIRLLETREPETAAAWKLHVPSEDGRAALVEEVLKSVRDSEKRREEEADGIPLGEGTKIPYNKVIRIENTEPFSRYARLSRHPWAGRVRLVSIAAVFVIGFSVLVTISAVGGFSYLAYLLTSLWPFTVPLAIAALILFELELSRRQYAEECRGRFEFAVLFSPRNFLSGPTQVMFGRYCPAAIFSMPTRADGDSDD